MKAMKIAAPSFPIMCRPLRHPPDSAMPRRVNAANPGVPERDECGKIVTRSARRAIVGVVTTLDRRTLLIGAGAALALRGCGRSEADPAQPPPASGKAGKLIAA